MSVSTLPYTLSDKLMLMRQLKVKDNEMAKSTGLPGRDLLLTCSRCVMRRWMTVIFHSTIRNNKAVHWDVEMS